MKTFSFLMLFLYSLNSFALTYASNIEILQLTVINHSLQTLYYAGTKNSNSFFTLTAKEILPGGQISISSKANFTSIKGNLIFKDQAGNNNILQIWDPVQIVRQKNTEKFILNNARLISFIPEVTFNQSNSPNSLAFTQATIEIQNRLIV